MNFNIPQMFLQSRIYRFWLGAVMRWFSSPEKFMKWYLSKKHGSVQLEDGTWVVNQSDEFHKWCYSEGYKRWKETNA